MNPSHRRASSSRLQAGRALVWILGITGGLIAMVLMKIADEHKGRAYLAYESRTIAMNNLQRIGMMLIEFDTEYGQLPDVATIPAVKEKTKTSLTLGSASSNEVFRQLLLSEGGKSEAPFWVKTVASRKKPDDVFSSDSTALAKGECGFAYVTGRSYDDDPNTPVVMTSLLPGKLLFDRETFDGKAVILFMDSQVQALPIEKDGRVLVNGLDLFDPRQPFWKGKTPDVKWPE